MAAAAHVLSLSCFDARDRSDATEVAVGRQLEVDSRQRAHLSCWFAAAWAAGPHVDTGTSNLPISSVATAIPHSLQHGPSPQSLHSGQ